MTAKIIFAMLVLTAFAMSAAAIMLIPANDNAKEHAKAPEKSPAIGESWELERVDFIHYAKPSAAGKPPRTNSCYKLMGVKWSALPVGYTINPANPQGLNASFITGAVLTAAETWDASTAAELFYDAYAVDYGAKYGVYDGKNSIAFGQYPTSGVIAVTSVWYTRKGRQIVEFDMLFNTDFSWGNADINPAAMDLQNIATHELGHAVGLDDIYSTSCTQVTMYGYSTEGEIQKRTLEQPDVNGLTAMYGQ